MCWVLKVAPYSFRSVAEILSTREISSATRNTRGRRCMCGGFFKIAIPTNIFIAPKHRDIHARAFVGLSAGRARKFKS